MVYHQKIAEKIKAAQNGNKDSIIDLMNMFQPLLRNLATHLNYEDAINDLELEFIQLIKTIKLSLLRSCDDGSIIRYIQQSLKYKSYQLSNTHRAKMRTEIPHCSYSEEQLFAIENQNAICDDYGSLLLSEAKMVLTKKEYEIIKKHIIDDVPVEQLAQKMGTSRQAINQSKNRALNKLRTLYQHTIDNTKEKA